MGSVRSVPWPSLAQGFARLRKASQGFARLRKARLKWLRKAPVDTTIGTIFLRSPRFLRSGGADDARRGRSKGSGVTGAEYLEENAHS